MTKYLCKFYIIVSIDWGFFVSLYLYVFLINIFSIFIAIEWLNFNEWAVRGKICWMKHLNGQIRNIRLLRYCLRTHACNTWILKQYKVGKFIESVFELKEEVAMFHLVTCNQKGHLMCGGRLYCVQCTLGTEDRKWNTPLWPYPPLWARSPHAPLVCCCWQGARLIMCSLLQPRRERESGRGAEGWLPRPAGSPGPNTALMRAGGADGHTRGARDYCPGPRGAKERDPRRGGEETPAGTPEADLYSCSHFASMC